MSCGRPGDRGVKVEMIVYKGYGHSIASPIHARRDAAQPGLVQSLYLGRSVPDFTSPEVPKTEDKPKDSTGN